MNFDRFIQLIRAFQARVQSAVELFRVHRKLEQPMHWRDAGLSQTGCIDQAGTIRYYFHGIGCRVEMPSGGIDWDFGHEGRLDGFDLWRLRQFAEDDATDFPEFADQKALERTFTAAIENGIIHSPFRDRYDYLFYLRCA